MNPRRKLLTIVLALFVAAIVILAGVYLTIPTSNTNLTHFDTILVLGNPANPDGTPGPEQRERTLEAVREFKAGVAPRIIFSGAAAHNQFVEAHVMATLALAQGVPPDAVIEEDQALTTIQNIFYAQRIMAAHHWGSVEVVSSPSHLPRTALILRHFPVLWRTHPSLWPSEYHFWQKAVLFYGEAEHCLKLRTLGFPASRFLPSTAPAL
jgi:uncharacterized SAM-binding protein YcdF (DUF218 family)